MSTHTHSSEADGDTPILPPASLTRVKEPIVIQGALPPPIVCGSWKPLELIQTSAHSTAPPPPAALSFLFFISLSLSLPPHPSFPLPTPPSFSYADWALQSVTHTSTAGPAQTHTGTEEKAGQHYKQCVTCFTETTYYFPLFFTTLNL